MANVKISELPVGITVTDADLIPVVQGGVTRKVERGDLVPVTAVDSDDVTYTPTTLADWDSAADPGDVEQALDQLAERVTDVEGAVAGSVDSDDVTYTPTTLADWDSSADPGDVEQALDQLAERVTDVEGGGPGGMAIGDTVTSGTAGSILFVGTGPVLAQDNANLFYDNTNDRVGVGTTGPAAKIHVAFNDAASAGTQSNGIFVKNASTASNSAAYVQAAANNGAIAAAIIADGLGNYTGTPSGVVAAAGGPIILATDNGGTSGTERARISTTAAQFSVPVGIHVSPSSDFALHIAKSNATAYPAVGAYINNTSVATHSLGYLMVGGNNSTVQGYIEADGLGTHDGTDGNPSVNVAARTAHQLNFLTDNDQRASIDASGNAVWGNVAGTSRVRSSLATPSSPALADGDWWLDEATGVYRLKVRDSSSTIIVASTEIEELKTADTTTTKVLSPDGAGGVEWRAESAGGGGALTLVEHKTVTSNSTTVTFSGLNGNTDGAYRLMMKLVNNSGSGPFYKLAPNGATTNLASGQFYQSAGTPGASGYSDKLTLGFANSDADYYSGSFDIFPRKTADSIGLPLHYSGHWITLDGSTLYSGTAGGQWTETSTNVTSLDVVATISNGIGEGSELWLYKYGQ